MWDAEAAVGSPVAGHRSQEADAIPERRAEPVPAAEDAQEGKGGNCLAIRVNPKRISLTVFPNLSSWDRIRPHLQTPVPARNTLISRSPIYQPFPATIKREKRKNKKPIGIDTSFSLSLPLYFIKNVSININV